MSKPKDEIGNRYGKLLVLSISDRPNKKSAMSFNCICDCGKNIVAIGHALRSGQTSCGCERSITRVRHGDSKIGKLTKEYMIYFSMKGRCTNQNNKSYSRYGGRGINICDRWFNSYENFLSDMGRAPTQKHTIERIDNDGNYEPSNCKWATNKEQQNNKRNNLYLNVNGSKFKTSEFCDLLNIKIQRFNYFYYKKRISAQEIYNSHFKK